MEEKKSPTIIRSTGLSRGMRDYHLFKCLDSGHENLLYKYIMEAALFFQSKLCNKTYTHTTV